VLDAGGIPNVVHFEGQVTHGDGTKEAFSGQGHNAPSITDLETLIRDARIRQQQID
jgi:hypothetical protein